MGHKSRVKLRRNYKQEMITLFPYIPKSTAFIVPVIKEKTCEQEGYYRTYNIYYHNSLLYLSRIVEWSPFLSSTVDKRF